MSGLRAMIAGARRAAGSPVILVVLWLSNVAIAVPGTWIVLSSIEDTLGSSRAHESLRTGFDMGWYGEYQARVDGVASTLAPTHTGVGAFYDNLEDFLGGQLIKDPTFMIASGIVFAALWLFVLGGTLDRFADRDTRPGPGRFLTASRGFFFRFARLAVFSVGLYAGVYLLSRAMFRWMEQATVDVTVEGTIFFYSLLIWALTALLLTLIHACFGFAKVATVTENRRSMLLAALRGIVFVARHPGKCLSLYYGFLLVSGLLLAVYAMVGPGVGQQTHEAVIRAFAVSQLFLLFKLFVRLSLLGGQTALYQAHGLPRRSERDLSMQGEQSA